MIHVDTFVKWNHGPKDLEQFFSHINIQTPAIQFTMEMENQGTLPFWDVNVEQDVNKLKFKVHRKNALINQHLHLKSNECKKCILVKTLYHTSFNH